MCAQVSMDEAKEMLGRARAGENGLARTLDTLVRLTGGYARSPYTWMIPLDDKEIKKLIHRDNLKEGRILLELCRQGEVACNAFNLTQLLSNVDLLQIGTTQEEVESLLYLDDLRRARECLEVCRAEVEQRGMLDGLIYVGGSAVALHRLVPVRISYEELGTSEMEVRTFRPTHFRDK